MPERLEHFGTPCYEPEQDPIECKNCHERRYEADMIHRHGHDFCDAGCADDWESVNMHWCIGCEKPHWTDEPAFIFDDKCLCEDAWGDEEALQKMLKHIAKIMPSTAKVIEERNE